MKQVLLRCFVRVNGVMARVIDTKYVCKIRPSADRCYHEIVVVRESTWKEGSWEQYAGTNASAWIDFGFKPYEGKYKKRKRERASRNECS